MNKSIFFTIISLFIIVGVYGQDFRKEWTDGKLTWNDFQEKEESTGVSELKYFIGYNTGKQKFSDTTFIGMKTYCYVDNNLSWVNKYYKNDQYLKYNQVIFNLVELYRRKLQYELNRVNSTYEAEIRYHQYYNDLNYMVVKFQKETNGGQKQEIIAQWGLIINTELKNHENIKIPKFNKRNFGYALHAGLGSGIFTGTLGQHFGQTFNFIFGFDFAYKKSILYLNGTLAGGKVIKDYISAKSWYEGQNANVAIIDASYGYAVVDKSKIKLSPFIGLGITELSGINKDNKEDALRYVDYNFIFGLNADYKIRKRIKLLQKEAVETSIRARLYITKANYFDDLNGYSINLTIGLCGFGNLLRLRD